MFLFVHNSLTLIILDPQSRCQLCEGAMYPARCSTLVDPAEQHVVLGDEGEVGDGAGIV